MCGALLASQNVNNNKKQIERYNVDTTKTITHLSLCTGYEGIGIGLRRVLPNLREIAYVEREGFPVANLVAKIESGQLDEAPIFTDVKTFPYRKFRGCVDILSGGFPCQPFSSAGKRKATEDPRHLFPYIRDGIRDCQPRIVFLENVEGIISAKTGDGESVLQYVIRELEGLGYRATAGVFSASEVGFPHQRKRVFILGYSEYNGCSSTKELRSSSEASNDCTKGEEQSSESKRTSGPNLCEGIQRCEELANSTTKRLEVRGTETFQQTENDRNSSKRNILRRPSRPNEEQYEWECPRVIQVKPRLGGAAYGSSSRLDRLRLLGNGVVPATAAKAFATLINRIL